MLSIIVLQSFDSCTFLICHNGGEVLCGLVLALSLSSYTNTVLENPVLEATVFDRIYILWMIYTVHYSYMLVAYQNVLENYFLDFLSNLL